LDRCVHCRMFLFYRKALTQGMPARPWTVATRTAYGLRKATARRAYTRPSPAMVLQIGRSETPDEDVLCIENSNARLLRPFVGDHPESFAIPRWLHETDGFRLLWPPFASGEWTLQSVRGAGSTRLNLKWPNSGRGPILRPTAIDLFIPMPLSAARIWPLFDPFAARRRQHGEVSLAHGTRPDRIVAHQAPRIGTKNRS
jgi:hypothetical protein